MSKAKFALLSSAVGVSILNTTSSILSFFVQLILAKNFSTSFQMDAYFAAVGLPQVLLRLLGGPMYQVFIPVFKDLELKSKESAENFARSIFWIITSFFTLVAGLIFWLSLPISKLLIQGSDDKTILLASNILKILALYLAISGIYFTLQAIHLAYKNYLVSNIGNMFSSLMVVAYTALFVKEQGIYAPVIGLVLGTSIQATLNLIYLPIPLIHTTRLPWKKLREFATLFIPFGFASVFYRATPVIERYFASFLNQGDVAMLGYGSRILESLVILISSGLAVVMFPLSSEYSAKTDKKRLANFFSWGTRTILIILIPIVGYLIFFSNDLIRVLFERGSFGPEQTQQVSSVLTFYSGAILALCLGGQLTNILYAQKKHLKVMIINITIFPIYILLAHYLSVKDGVYGIAKAYSLQTLLSIIVYTYFVHKMIIVEWGEIARVFSHVLISSFIMIAVLYLSTDLPFFSGWPTLRFGIELLFGVATYGICLLILRNKETLLILSHSYSLIKKK